MGTGLWEVDSLDPTTGAKLSANPYWWGGAAPIQNFSFQIFANATSEALAFRADDVDLDPSVVGPKTFAASSGATIEAAPSCLNGMLDMNVHAPGWDDVHVRRAVAYALDRAQINDAFGGYAVPDYTLIPGSALRTIASQEQVNVLFKSLPLCPYNLAKAKAEMAESSYQHGFIRPSSSTAMGTPSTSAKSFPLSWPRSGSTHRSRWNRSTLMKRPRPVRPASTCLRFKQAAA